MVALTIALLPVVLSACEGQPLSPDEVSGAAGRLTAPGYDLDLDPPLFGGQEELGSSARPLGVPPSDLPEDYDLDEALISRATSSPYVAPGSAGNEAKTTFTGNRIKVDVYTTVKFLAEPIVTEFLQTTQDTYLLPQTEKRHTAFSSVRIEGLCGHTATGHAQHIAWIDYGPYEWGETERPSVGAPFSQPACEKEDLPVDESDRSGGGDEPPPGEIYTCWYRYYYDIDTGEILHAELLYCETV
jgi:hypothetical protein